MSEERFSVWLSMAARDRPIRSRMLPELGRAGFWRKMGSRPHFSGVRIGRGAGVGRVLSASGAAFAHGRRVATETRVIRLERGGPSGAVRDHLRYLVRAREGEERRLALYGPEDAAPDAAAFARSCRDDRHQFRTIVGAQDACEYEDLRPLVRRLMTQAARDLRTPLSWVAVDHHDTAHPHSHIVIRGVDAGGGDLVIAREYIEHGFEQRTAALVALDLGPDLTAKNERYRGRGAEIALERPTAIDRDLMASMDGQGRVAPDYADRRGQAERAGRLRVLETLGLAHPDGEGRWYLQPDLIERLGEIEWLNRMALAPSRMAPAFGEDAEGVIDPVETNLDRESYEPSARSASPKHYLGSTDRYFAALGWDPSGWQERSLRDSGYRAPQKGRTADTPDNGVSISRNLADVLRSKDDLLVRSPDGPE